MPLSPETRELLKFLNSHPGVRNQIRAHRNKTLLYAGRFFKPVWQEIVQAKRTNGAVADKTILPEVLERIRLPNQPNRNLLEWAQEIDAIKPWEQNGYIAWRALSGIFASNAVGAVSFLIGSGVTKENNKVFASTEIHVLERNPNVDQVTKDAVQYYLRCVRTNRADIDTGLIHG